MLTVLRNFADQGGHFDAWTKGFLPQYKEHEMIASAKYICLNTQENIVK